MSASVKQHNNSNAVTMHQAHKFVSPFLEEAADNHSNASSSQQALGDSMNFAHNNNNNNNNNNHTTCHSYHAVHAQLLQKQPSGDKMGLRAASVVSAQDSPHAHEYQPTCNCADCQALLMNFTAFDIMDAYVNTHLAYEKRLEQLYGFVPCIGGPMGNVALRLDPATGQPAAHAVRETSNAMFFHHHRHTMKPVPHDFKQRSLNRYYEGSAASSNVVSPQQPSSKAHNTNNHNGQHQTRRFNNNNSNNNVNNGSRYQQQQHGYNNSHAQYQQQQQQAVMQSHGYFHNSQQQMPSQPQYYSGAAAAHYRQPVHYTAADVALEQQAAAFCTTARLGQQ